jgi:hypothetical protein
MTVVWDISSGKVIDKEIFEMIKQKLPIGPELLCHAYHFLACFFIQPAFATKRINIYCHVY